MNYDIEHIVNFILKHMPYLMTQREELMDALVKHIEYKTCLVINDRNGIVAVCLWNFDGETIDVLTACIRDDLRRNQFVKYLIAQGLIFHPQAKFISWERAIKTKKKFKFEINKILNRRTRNGKD